MEDLVSQKVNGPSIALIALGAVSILTNLASFIWQGIGAVTWIMAGDVDWMLFITSQGWSLGMNLFGAVASIVIILGGVRMRQQKSAGLVYAASAFAILPCCIGVPCCCLGIPIGIWALITLNDEDVKAAFEAA